MAIAQRQPGHHAQIDDIAAAIRVVHGLEASQDGLFGYVGHA